MADPLLIARHGDTECVLLPGLANRHGLVTGATGTGKTVTLQKMAEEFSRIGVPVFMSDVKGDLSGISQAGNIQGKMAEILKERGLPAPEPVACPATFWDVFGEQGHPVRATISDMGPLLLARMLDLNDTQSGVLNLVFKIADDNGLLLLDSKDLRAMLQYGRQRQAVHHAVRQRQLGQHRCHPARPAGAGEPGRRQVLRRAHAQHRRHDADQRRQGRGQHPGGRQAAHRAAPVRHLLLWLLSELFETLPEIGDPDKPKMVFFFDEAHLLFDDAPKVLLERIELVVRLVRSKGVGVYFVTQNPIDVPDSVLAQLGNRVQHALRAFTPRDQKAVKATAETMRGNPGINIEQAITELAVGEALVSFLDAKGRPSVTERVYVIPPGSQIGPITPEQRQQAIANSLVAGVYEKTVDRESAFEKLQSRAEGGKGDAPTAGSAGAAQKADAGGMADMAKEILFGRTGPRGGQHDGLVQTMAKSAVRTMGTSLGKEILRGVLGGLFGSKR